ncbi:MAG: hypothetical protein KAU90_12625, partial [Sulfurovaceae bacterium]|nr:hypothetical protein [Sulfurovaceae bacterium]
MIKKINFIKFSLISFIVILGIPYNLMAIPVSEATEVLEDIQKNENGESATYVEINDIDGVQNALTWADYAQALFDGTYADKANP